MSTVSDSVVEAFRELGRATAALNDGVANVFTDPADLVAALTQLIEDQSNITAREDVHFARMARQQNCARLCRAIGEYWLDSQDTANRLLLLVKRLLDAEIMLAADAFDDDAVLALRNLRTHTVLDLISRGTSLAPLVDVEFNAELPAPVIAQRMYQDGTRHAVDVTERGDVPNPLFCPTRMRLLAR